MKSQARALLAAMTLLLLAGCLSQGALPSYFRLEAMTTTGSGPKALSFGLRPIQLPEYARRGAVVRGTGQNTVAVSVSERWAEPLEDGVYRVMAINLASRLGTEDLRRFPWQSRRTPDIVVTLNVLDLLTQGDTAELIVDVGLTINNGEVINGIGASIDRLWTMSTSLSTSLSTAKGNASDGAAVARAYSELLGRLADNIAAEVSRAAGSAS